MMVKELDKRKVKILKAIIHEHILTAEPVGSRTLAKTYCLGVSSATIRNEMSDLEELGFLEQPYTSAGRVPSDQGYRFYVDRLMSEDIHYNLNMEKILNKTTREKQSVQEIISNMARMLSRITRYASVVSEPQLQGTKIKQLELIGIDNSSVLIVLITNTGIVHNKIVRLQEEITNRQIRYLNHFLASNLNQKELIKLNSSYMKELELELLKKLDLSQEIFSLIDQSLRKMSHPSDIRLYLGGTSYILDQPEFNNMENLKRVLSILDHEEMLRDLLYNIPDNGIEVLIGRENELEEMKNCSIVFSTYSIGNKASGKIGVIGPTRMEYSKVITLVNTMAEVLGKIILELSR